MNPLRILILVPDLPNPLKRIKGGIQAAVLNLIRGLASQPAEVLVVSVTSDTIQDPTVQLYPNIRIQYLSEGPSSFSFLNYLLFTPKGLNKIISEFKPDVIHFEEGMNFLLLRCRIPFKNRHVLTIHGITFAEARLKKNWLQRIKWYQNGIVEWLLLPKYLIHISKYSRKIFSSVAERNSPVIFNAVAPIFFDVPLKESMTNQILYVGVINVRKNIKSLLIALKALKDQGKRFELKVVGDFDPTEKYKKEVLEFIENNGLKDQIEFLGWRSQLELEQFYEATDIVVLPSLQETLPVVIAEAMASGRVMVATTVGGIPEMIDQGETGFVYAPHQEQQLIRILADLYNQPQLMRNLGEKARKAAEEKFHAAAIGAKTYAYYKEISMTIFAGATFLLNL